MGKITIDDIIIDFQNPSRQIESEKKVVLGMLVSYIKCFLDSTTFHGNELQAIRMMNKMFTFRHGMRIKGEIIQFKFPKDLRRQFLLNKEYRIALNRTSVYKFYIEELAPKSKLSCKISVHASGKEERLAINRIQKLVLMSSKHLKSVTIAHSKDKYMCVLESRITSVPKTVLPAKKILVDAIYALQEELLEEDGKE